MADTESNLGAWIARLREADATLGLKDALEAIDRDTLDNAVGFAAEHTRRYVASDGQDDGWDGPRPILILYTTGRSSGRTRRNPLLFFEHDGHRYVIGSKAGTTGTLRGTSTSSPTRVHVRVAASVYAAQARTLDDAEREAIWPRLVERYPMFAGYQNATARPIPVVQLVPVSDPAA